MAITSRKRILDMVANDKITRWQASTCRSPRSAFVEKSGHQLPLGAGQLSVQPVTDPTIGGSGGFLFIRDFLARAAFLEA